MVTISRTCLLAQFSLASDLNPLRNRAAMGKNLKVLFTKILHNTETHMYCCNTKERWTTFTTCRGAAFIPERLKCIAEVLDRNQDITLCPVEFIVSRSYWKPMETVGHSRATSVTKKQKQKQKQTNKKPCVIGKSEHPIGTEFFHENK